MNIMILVATLIATMRNCLPEELLFLFHHLHTVIILKPFKNISLEIF